jgi:hypothetical protein
VTLSLGCTAVPSDQQRVQAKYDQTSGKLSQLTVDVKTDGKPNITGYLDGTTFLRIEIDSNEDGKIDRWEHYGAAQRITRVGISRSNNGKEDAWLVQGADTSATRLEISTRRDGTVDRTEFHQNGTLTRAEEDTDADGRVDKWEYYESGALVRVSFDTARSGKPTTTIDYRK